MWKNIVRQKEIKNSEYTILIFSMNEKRVKSPVAYQPI